MRLPFIQGIPLFRPFVRFGGSLIFQKGVITIFCDNAGISYNRVTGPLETLFHYYINGAQKVIRQVGLTTGYCEI